MIESDPTRYSDAELEAEFEQLFPLGFAGLDVFKEIAPRGWEFSDLLKTFHPSPEQVYEESLRTHRNMLRLRLSNDERPDPPEPTLEEVVDGFRESPIESEKEVRELVGMCLWDVFSDSHEVVGPDGRGLDLGSFRASGEFLADVLNRQIGAKRYDYMSFYMGTIWISGRADLTPVYRMIFRRFLNRRLDWVYHFPRLHAIDIRPLKEALDQQTQPAWLDYSPSKALAEESEKRARDQELDELGESLDAGDREAVEEALNTAPPETVSAYEAVYKRPPKGWPPAY